MKKVRVIPYQASWVSDYEMLEKRLKSFLQNRVSRIDHIGSTSVQGLAAKDIIDIQIAVPELSDEFVTVMTQQGHNYFPHLEDDRLPNADPKEWQKQVFNQPEGVRLCNIHVRKVDAANMRQNLLYRDYLRAHPNTANAHGLLKARLAERHPDDRDYYYEIKDPVSTIILEAAHFWAEQVDWQY